ncbi:DNA-binding protein [Panacibacter ginsenosidivorans]|uniref:DNA-binding protein n=1 Tax=Panacibacter ginsenosidivorans TaxID=1813871 RepID=A0A5B8VG07_9BACT|nr:DNA-binding protein [Panacibacter ginsenosidivorans]QEC69268.1 DNA-binding protein [Panacibacter ginsenosidivorans]
MAGKSDTPILVPMEMEVFWQEMRQLIRAELEQIIAAGKSAELSRRASKETTAFQQKPLYDMQETRQLFGNISRTTIYDWVKCGKLKPKKLKGKIFFLWCDIEKLINGL